MFFNILFALKASKVGPKSIDAPLFTSINSCINSLPSLFGKTHKVVPEENQHYLRGSKMGFIKISWQLNAKIIGLRFQALHF